VRRRQHRSTRDGSGCGDPAESSGRGSRYRYVEEPRKPQRLLIRGKLKQLTELGHARLKSQDMVWALDESGHKERTGRFARTNVEGVL
jgi:hypothetical protein